MKIKFIITALLLATLIVACGPSATPAESTPDVAAVRTSAASTVVSQFTLTAAAFTVTGPAPTEDVPTLGVTATATQPAVAQVTNAEGTTVALCDKYAWDPATVDVNVPDNTPMSPGQDFVKTWKIKNIGSCTWVEGYTMIYSYGYEKMSGQPQALAATVEPGDEVDISVNFKAPDLPGTYTSYWTLQNPKGIAFQGNEGKVLYVQIVVQ
jgi:hypothetical protein